MALDLSILSKAADYARQANPYDNMTVAQALAQAQGVRKSDYELQEMDEKERRRQQIRDYMDSLKATPDQVVPGAPATPGTPATEDKYSNDVTGVFRTPAQGSPVMLPRVDPASQYNFGFRNGVMPLPDNGSKEAGWVPEKPIPFAQAPEMKDAGPTVEGGANYNKLTKDWGPLVQNPDWRWPDAAQQPVSNNGASAYFPTKTDYTVDGGVSPILASNGWKETPYLTQFVTEQGKPATPGQAAGPDQVIKGKPAQPIDFSTLERLIAPNMPTEVAQLRRADVQEERIQAQADKAEANHSAVIMGKQDNALRGVTDKASYETQYQRLSGMSDDSFDYTKGMKSPDEFANDADAAAYASTFRGSKGGTIKPMTPIQVDNIISQNVDRVNNDPALANADRATKAKALETVLTTSYPRNPEIWERFKKASPVVNEQQQEIDATNPNNFVKANKFGFNYNPQATLNGQNGVDLRAMGLDPDLIARMSKQDPLHWGKKSALNGKIIDNRDQDMKDFDDAHNLTLDPETGELVDKDELSDGTFTTNAANGTVVDRDETGNPVANLTYDQALDLYGKHTTEDPDKKFDRLVKNLHLYMAGVHDKDGYDAVRNSLIKNNGFDENQISPYIPKDYDQQTVNGIANGSYLRGMALQTRNDAMKLRMKLMNQGFDAKNADLAGKAAEAGWKVRDQVVDKTTGKLLTGMASHIANADRRLGTDWQGTGPQGTNAQGEKEGGTNGARVSVVDALARLERGGQATEFSTNAQGEISQLLQKFGGATYITDDDWVGIRKVSKEAFEQMRDKVIPSVTQQSITAAADWLENAGIEPKDRTYTRTLDMVKRGIFDFKLHSRDANGAEVTEDITFPHNDYYDGKVENGWTKKKKP